MFTRHNDEGLAGLHRRAPARIDFRTKAVQVPKISLVISDASDRETEAVTVSGRGNQSAEILVGCSVIDSGRIWQSNLTISRSLDSS